MATYDESLLRRLRNKYPVGPAPGGMPTGRITAAPVAATSTSSDAEFGARGTEVSPRTSSSGRTVVPAPVRPQQGPRLDYGVGRTAPGTGVITDTGTGRKVWFDGKSIQTSGPRTGAPWTGSGSGTGTRTAPRAAAAPAGGQSAFTPAGDMIAEDRNRYTAYRESIFGGRDKVADVDRFNPAAPGGAVMSRSKDPEVRAWENSRNARLADIMTRKQQDVNAQTQNANTAQTAATNRADIERGQLGIDRGRLALDTQNAGAENEFRRSAAELNLAGVPEAQLKGQDALTLSTLRSQLLNEPDPQKQAAIAMQIQGFLGKDTTQNQFDFFTTQGDFGPEVMVGDKTSGDVRNLTEERKNRAYAAAQAAIKRDPAQRDALLKELQTTYGFTEDQLTGL